MALPRWLELAKSQIGVEEIPGDEANSKIVEYHASTKLKATSDDVAWCAAFVCWCLEQSHIPSTKSAAARSYLDWGVSIDHGMLGAIVILARGPDKTKGHVGFYYGEDKDQVYLIGGNQSNKVCIKGYYKYNVLGYRVPDDDYWSADDINTTNYFSDS